MRRSQTGAGERGFTLIELLIVVAIIGILVTIALAAYYTVQRQARISKAQADIRTLVYAVTAYQAHCGWLPGGAGTNCPAGTAGAAGLASLTATQKNNQNDTTGPFVNTVPNPPQGWAAYTYVANTDGTFIVCSSGDSTVANSNGGTTCP